MKRWLGLGGDFSAIGTQVLSGAGTINGSETVFTPLLIANEELAAPPPGLANVPFTSTSYTFALGPQFYLQKGERVTLFARPGFDEIHENANIDLPPQLGGLLTLLGPLCLVLTRLILNCSLDWAVASTSTYLGWSACASPPTG